MSAAAGHEGKGWGGRRDSNPQQQAPQAWTLPLSYDHQPALKLEFRCGPVKSRSNPQAAGRLRLRCREKS
jgi:hypothetical protein